MHTQVTRGYLPNGPTPLRLPHRLTPLRLPAASAHNKAPQPNPSILRPQVGPAHIGIIYVRTLDSHLSSLPLTQRRQRRQRLPPTSGKTAAAGRGRTHEAIPQCSSSGALEFAGTAGEDEKLLYRSRQFAEGP